MKISIAVKITLIYFIVGFLWILFSDLLLNNLERSFGPFPFLQTYKGWFFILITASLLFQLISKEIKTRSIIEADLIKAKEKAEESSRLKSAFLANMSHEIRTPLNSIMGFNELMLDDSFSGEDKQVFAKHMAKNGNDLLKLINDILDISKIQENQFTITKKNFILNQFLNSFYDEYQQSEIRKQLQRIEFILIKGEEETDTELFSDTTRLAHILTNLLNNAFFFTKKGTVRFGYKKLASSIEFFVEDSGCGINDSDKELIFKPFFKGKEHVIGNKGFGLGLAISKGMASLLGGELKFDSIPNVGSRFYFSIENQNILASTQKSKNMINEILKTKAVNFDPSKINMNQN